MTDDEFITNELRLACSDVIELVTAYLDDALSETDLRRFEQHRGGCEACRVYIDQIRHTIKIAAAARDDAVQVRPANFEALVAELRLRSNQ
ncbi:zf-HC2 domain-containing protein [Mycobacterium sp. 050272]|uniref:anti-sigma factor family protein n=1 Tax=Mycobacteriaceae TaxID=1762 RepID=UPI00319D13DC